MSQTDIIRPRVAPPPDPEKLRETHKHYQLFLQQNFITPDMEYVAYQLKHGQAQFVAGAPTLDVLVSSLNDKLGVPREPCLFMDLSHHRNYDPQ